MGAGIYGVPFRADPLGELRQVHISGRDDEHDATESALTRFLDDGRYQLRLPYSNDPELIMDVLKYGPDCEVVAPAGLREKVVGLLRAAVGRYGDE